MKNRPIHENLDTSFVNLSALLRYLRRRQFAGNIRVELSGYEADIVLTGENQMNVREYDRIAGRIAEGEEALQRLLIRAREPGGIIHVYQHVANTETVQKEEVKIENNATEVLKPEVETFQTAAVEIKKTVAANGKSTIVEAAPPTVPTLFVKPAAPLAESAKKIEIVKQPEAAKPEKLVETRPTLPDFPFILSNNFEAKAKQKQLSAEDWQQLLNLTGELLQTIDECLAKAQLDFTAAFQKAGAEVSADYPFLNPQAEIFVYRRGRIGMSEQTNAKIFAAGINETLRRILEKLGASEKFAEVHRYTVHKIIALVHHRKSLYDKFSITPQLEKNLGI